MGVPGPYKLVVSTDGVDGFMKGALGAGAGGAGAGGTKVATDAGGISSAGAGTWSWRSFGAAGAGAGGTGVVSFIFFEQPSLEGDQDLNRANALLGDAT